MDNIENRGCILISKKEYEELQRKANDKAPKEIKIVWGFDYQSGYVTGDIDLSQSLLKQVLQIRMYIKNDMKKYQIGVRDVNKREFIKKLRCLPWYKRIWFKPEYIS